MCIRNATKFQVKRKKIFVNLDFFMFKPKVNLNSKKLKKKSLPLNNEQKKNQKI